jgi:hypothetical protein
VRLLEPDRLRAEALKILEDAGEDGKALEGRVHELLSKIDAQKAAADGGDWIAEADLATALTDSQDLFWKLRTFAALNSP